MISIYAKTVKIVLLALTPLFLISNTKAVDGLNETTFLEGKYNLQASGSLNQELKGSVNFKSKIETRINGTSTATLELKLVNDNSSAQHSIGFLIMRQNQRNEISAGTYRVAEDINGFLNGFDGVFGFANVDVFGEQPFFAQKGSIVLTNLDTNLLQGRMAVTLRNSSGKLIRVKGNFTAIR